MSNSWALWRRRLIDNAQLAVAMQAKLAKEVAFMRHRSTRLAQRTTLATVRLSGSRVPLDYLNLGGSGVWLSILDNLA